MSGREPRRTPGRSPRQRAGDIAENAACEHLARHGLRVVARNVSYRLGEIDAVAVDGDVLVFVEVRSRERAGFAAASIDAAKRARLRRAAQLYLRAHYGQHWPACRFDAVIVEAGRIEWLRAAFGADEEDR